MFMDFPKKGEGTDHRCIVYLKKKEVFKTQSPVKAPEALRTTYWCCLEFCTCSGKDLSVLSAKDYHSTKCFKDCHMKVKYWSLIYFCRILGLYFI